MTLFLTSNIFNNLPFIKHAFFTKNALGATGKKWFYENKNINADISEKLNKLLNCINRDIHDLILLDQVHGNDVLLADSRLDIQQYDAVVTKLPKLTLGIRTADCIPLLLVDPINKIIGAAHAGWRGAFAGIVENTIAKMNNMGSKNSDILSVIGPCIHQSSYEVSNEFFDQFINSNHNNMKYFINSINASHCMFDLPQYVIDKLIKLGIGKIDNLMINTYIDDRFFSFRKFTHQKQKDEEMGYILSLITLEV